MKRQNEELLGDVLRRTIEESGMTARLYETRAASLWPVIVGPAIAARSARPSVRVGVMTVSVASAPLRQELAMNRSHLIDIMNRTLGRNVISDIRFIG